MTVAGLGCRKGVTPAEVRDAIEAALAATGIRLEQLDSLATGSFKGSEQALHDAAHQLGLPLAIVGQSELTEAAERTLTISRNSLAATGLPSLSEASALAAAGPASRLLGPRTIVGNVTCAIATDEAAS